MLTEDNKELYEQYFQKNSDYYIDQMESYKERGRYSFSVAAFFLGIFWMAYRKMYLYILIIIGIIYAETFIEELLFNLNIISGNTYEIIDKLSMLVWGFVIGAISNRLYISKSQKTIQKILEENSKEDQVNDLISRKGGTSWIAPILLLIVLVSFVLLSLLLDGI